MRTETTAGSILVGAVKGYRIAISPFLAPRCRFLPTCSEYAIEAIQRYGAARGGVLALRRFCRCHPFGGSGVDEVPSAPHAEEHGSAPSSIAQESSRR